jgi:hypothetical protein
VSTYLYKVTESNLSTVAIGSMVVDNDRDGAAPGIRTWHLWSPLTKRVTLAYRGVIVAKLCTICRSEHDVAALVDHAGPCPGPSYVPFDPAGDPDCTVRLDPAAEAEEWGVGLDEIGGVEDSVGWDLHGSARLTFSDDHEFNDSRSLHYVLASSSGLPACVIRTVTPVQLRAFAQSLMALADRAAERRTTTEGAAP